MAEVSSIISLALTVAKIPQSVKINQSQCRLLGERIVVLADYLERLRDGEKPMNTDEKHEEALLRAQSVIVSCQQFMSGFEDGLWMAKALFREKHREQFQELHESITYVFEALRLEINYLSLKKSTVQAEAADVARMEEQLALVATNMEKLQVSVSTMTDDSRKHHEEVMAALKDIRVYRKTLNHDQLQAALAEAERDKGDGGAAYGEGVPKRTAAAHPCSALPIPPQEHGPKPPIVPGVSEVSVEGGLDDGSDEWSGPLAPPSASLSGKVSPAAPPKKLLGPSLHLKPYSQSYGVGMEAEVLGGAWLNDPGLAAKEPVVGEGGAKRGEYEVSFGEGRMGMSLRNIDARAEVTKVEPGGAARAAGVRPGDNVIGINGRVPLGYTQVMGALPMAPRPIRVRFVRGEGATVSPGTQDKRHHASTWTSNAVTAGVHHPAGDRGVLLEMYAQASFSPRPWVRSQGWDQLPLPTAGEQAAESSTALSSASETATHEVIEVHLPGNNMNGVLPPSIGCLEDLRSVELRENRFEGNIPESVRYLRKLTKLDLAHNLLEGSVPSGDSRWVRNMCILLLNNNKLSGHIPSNLGRLPNLKQLDLSHNVLSGHLPSELSGARSLEVLSLAHNGIAGVIPQSLGELTGLKCLNISNNRLSGTLPEGMGTLCSLEDLRLSHNGLSGAVPDDLFGASLVVLDLSCNALTGQIPHSVGATSRKLTGLDISRNALSGELPSNIGRLSKLKRLNLERNVIEGPLPTSLAELRALEDLNLSNNLLVGPLLHVLWGNLSKLQHLHLANNKLGESLPASLGSLPSLVSLTLNANQLTGNIPREWHNMTGLKLLDLSGNKIAASLLPLGSFFSEKRTLKKKLSACDVRF